MGEYMLGLDALGLGGKAEEIWTHMMAGDGRRVLLEQRALLERSIETEENHDAEVLALDDKLAAAYERCVESLKTLWRAEGPREDIL